MLTIVAILGEIAFGNLLSLVVLLLIEPDLIVSFGRYYSRQCNIPGFGSSSDGVLETIA